MLCISKICCSIQIKLLDQQKMLPVRLAVDARVEVSSCCEEEARDNNNLHEKRHFTEKELTPLVSAY